MSKTTKIKALHKSKSLLDRKDVCFLPGKIGDEIVRVNMVDKNLNFFLLVYCKTTAQSHYHL